MINIEPQRALIRFKSNGNVVLDSKPRIGIPLQSFPQDQPSKVVGYQASGIYDCVQEKKEHESIKY